MTKFRRLLHGNNDMTLSQPKHPEFRAPSIQSSQSSASPAVNLPDIRPQPPLKGVAPNGHLELVEGVLHDVVAVELVDAAHGHVDIGLGGVGEEEELCAGEGVEALHAEVLRLEDLEAGGAGGFVGVQAGGDGVDAGGVSMVGRGGKRGKGAYPWNVPARTR